MAKFFRHTKGPRKIKKKPEYNGVKFASAAEIKCAKDMDNRGICFYYEPERWSWNPPPKKYTVDFKVVRADGSCFYVEYKGYFRTEDKTKMAAIKKQYPEKDIRLVFTYPDKPVEGATVRKDGTKLSNAEWATKNGYKFAEKTIPDEWLERNG